MRCATACFAALGCFWVAALSEDLANEGVCAAGDSSCAKWPVAEGAGDVEELRWNPVTISVVLACAFEGKFAQNSVESVSNSVPGGSGGSILVDIVVVDDGSVPPLSKNFMKKKFRERYGVTLVRHEQSQGLIRAKSAGAAAAKGDIIVFFDCHVAPQPGWHEEFLKASAQNYRRIVVPVITDLDIDTWQQRSRTQSVSKCYLTWDADFKWFDSSAPDIPVLSGGLLGISRRWWNETGGYDTEMVQWGGENIDQSLRTWLCGGEILALPKAFVAHMWRHSGDPRTDTKYKVSPMNVIRNRVRAAKGWFGNFAKKLDDYPDMQYVSRAKMDLSNFEKVQQQLKCRPFAWFLWRFRDLYEGAGLLPTETFRIEHIKTGHCLTYLGPSGTHPAGRDSVALQPCGKPERNRRWPSVLNDPQRWHAANKDRKTGKCCGGLRVWNTDQCLVMNWKSQTASTVVCDTGGKHGNIVFTDTDTVKELAPGQLLNSDHEWVCLARKKKQVQAGTCKPSKKGQVDPIVWRKVEPLVPLETQLYREALNEHPELFVA